jgi:hypothetical protein
MPLTQEDKDWLSTKFESFENSLKSLTTSHHAMGKRVTRVEHAFDELSRLARLKVVEAAKKNHARLVQEMFDGSEILAVPSLVDGEEGGAKVRGAIPCDVGKVEGFLSGYGGEYDVELAPKLGFRLVHTSRSAQKRRKDGGHILKNAKEDAKTKLGLHLQYDKPFELRVIQGKAQKFLASLKREGRGLVVSTSARGGCVYANDVRLAPEYLVPEMHRWNGLIAQILTKIPGWGTRVPNSPNNGVMYDMFGFEFAADQGIFDLADVRSDDYEMMYT